MLRREILDLHDDGFDGSTDELRISQEVFYGNFAGLFSKRYAAAGAINSACDESKMVGIPISSHSENSALTNQASSKDLSQKDVDSVECHRESREGSIIGARIDHDVHAKRMKLSVNELFNFRPYLDKAVTSSIPVKQVVSGMCHPTPLSSCQILMCHVVESSTEGVTSSCYLLQQYAESGRVGNSEGGIAPKGNLLASDGSALMLGSGSNSIASPVSQESSATELLVPSPSAAIVRDSRSLQCVMRRPKREMSSELEDGDVFLNCDSIKGSRDVLRYRVLRLLERGGWSTERRKRDCNRFRYMYQSPEGKPFRELGRVWNLFAKSLFAHGIIPVAGDDKRWTYVGEFWSDFYDTLRYIDSKTDDWEPRLALAHEWSLLNPFVTLVLIDRKTHTLRAGHPVKAKQGNAVVNRHGDKIVCDSYLASDSAVVDGDGRSKKGTHNKRKSIYVSEGNSLRLVKTINKFEDQSLGTCIDDNMHIYSSQMTSPPDSTCLQYSSCLYNVPVGKADVNMIYGKPGPFSPHQDSNLSSPSYNKQNAEHIKGNTKGLADCSLDGVVLHDYVESQSCWKGMRPKKRASSKRRPKTCQLKDDDLLISAIIKKRSFKSSRNAGSTESMKLKPLRKSKSQKGSCRLLPRNIGKGGKHFKERWSIVGKRTVLSWLISAGALFLNETIQYRDPKDDAVVKDGLILKDGILCNCCSELFSVSRFKVHASFKQNRPCLNLFMGSGRPFTLCQLQAWSAEYKARKSSTRSVPVDEFDRNDDSCGLCGDGGELLCCDNCPSTFHQSCLSAKELPEGSWYCLNCTCRLCGDLVNDKETSTSDVPLKCSQCEKKYHQRCLIDRGIGNVDGSPWFCGIGCEKVYGGLQSRIGLSNLIVDGYSWALLRCIHDDQKVSSTHRFALKAECNSKLAVAVTIMEECFLSMTDPRTGIDMIPQVVYNWGSEFARLDYRGFYAAVLEKDDVLISVACIRVHGAAVAEMPLIATCSKYRRQGMCRRLLSSIEKMLISLKVEKLVIAAIPDLVETWTIGFGFIPMEEDEKRSLSKLNLMVFPGTVMLKMTLYTNQGSPPQEGYLDASSLEKGESFQTKVGLQGDLVMDAMSAITEAREDVAGEPKVKLASSSVMYGVDNPKSYGSAAGTGEVSNNSVSSVCMDEKNHLTGFRPLEQLSGLSDMQIGLEKETCKSSEDMGLTEGTREPDNCIIPRASAVKSEINFEGNTSLHVLEDPNICSEVAEEQETLETVEENPISEAEMGKAEKPENMDQEFEVPPAVESEATSDLANSVPGQVRESEGITEVDDTKEEEGAADLCSVIGTTDGNLKPQGSRETLFSLQKHSSDACFEHVVPDLGRGDVSDSEFQCVNNKLNQLTSVEQSQEVLSAVVNQLENRIMDSEATSDLNSVPGHVRGSDSFIQANDGKEDEGAAAVKSGIGADVDNLKPQGSIETVFCLRKPSCNACFELDVPILAREEVSGTETRFVYDNGNQLSSIEQSQEASVLPQSW